MKDKELITEYIINNFDEVKKRIKELSPYERILTMIVLAEILINWKEE